MSSNTSTIDLLLERLAPAYEGAKPSMVVPADKWDDADWLVPLIRTTVANLPPHNARK